MYDRSCAAKHLRRIILILVGIALCSTATYAQDGDATPTIRFVPHAYNPVLPRGEDQWGGECGTIFGPQVIQHDNLLYLFYTGSCSRTGRPAAIGYATSSDGIHWNRYDQNPILEPDGTGYDALCVSMGVPMVDHDHWVLYYAGNSIPCAGPGQYIGRAVAAQPDLPWQRDEVPILTVGEAGEWDEGFIMPHAAIHTEQGYMLFYSAGDDYLLPLPRLVGAATSPDGITWIKYDDPSTIEPPFAHSDPILEIDSEGKAIPFSAWALDVEKTEQGWEMFFSTTCPELTFPNCPTFIGYATSEDGLHWRTYRSLETAVLTRSQVNQDWADYCICQPSFIRSGEEYYLYFTGCTEETNDCQIGLAVGTISWGPS